MDTTKTRVSTSQKLAAKIEIYENKDGSLDFKNVRLEPRGGEQPDGDDGLRKAQQFDEMPTKKFGNTHEKVEPEAIVIFKGHCLYAGGVWHY
jgi:hypothetical protein